MRALIVGLGTIGRRHLANLRRIEPDCTVTAWRQHHGPSAVSELLPATDVVFNAKDALATNPDFALITGPASVRVETAMMLAQRGIHLLLEKPLSTSLDGVDALIECCRERSVALLVGYNFRFYEPLRRVRQAIVDGRVGRVLSVRAEVGRFLPEWRPHSNYRDTVTAQAALGGGVLFELSHEIDYVRWLGGEVEDVSAHIGRLGDLDVDVEDIAEITLSFKSGAIGSIHLDMIQRAPIRTCRIAGVAGTLVWDGLSHEVSWYSADTGTWTSLSHGDVDYNDMYLEELRHFLDCVRGGVSPAVSGEIGRQVLSIVLAAKQSSAERRFVTL